MQEGTVKWFNTRKGYGFICTSDGRDIFVHYSNIVGDGYRSLIEGDIVTFDIAEGEKGLRAENVVQKSSSQTKKVSESSQAKKVPESNQAKKVPKSK